MTDTRIRVLVADDEELVRAALVALLQREDDIDVVATAADGRQSLERALAHRPDVAVIDLQMPVLDGIGVVTELNRQLPACAAVILTGHGRPQVLRQALASGARGFLAKGAPSTALADVVRRVHESQRYVDPILAADALTEAPSPLTPREAEVLAAAGEDRRIRDVARALSSLRARSATTWRLSPRSWRLNHERRRTGSPARMDGSEWDVSRGRAVAARANS
jgi:two-component system response regulator DesR